MISLAALVYLYRILIEDRVYVRIQTSLLARTLALASTLARHRQTT